MSFDGWTFGFEIVNFLVLAFLLQRFAYRPLLAGIDRRRAETNRQIEAARIDRQQAEALRAELEAACAGLAKQREAALAEARQAARGERQKLLDEARQQAEALIEEGRRSLEGERRAACGELRRQAGELAVGIAEHLVAAVGGPAVRQALIDEALDELAKLDAAGRDSLLASLASSPDPSLDGVPVVLATAQPLEPAELAAVEQRLSGLLGRRLQLEAEVEPGLIEGLELRFPHLTLRHSWRHGLDEALKEIVREDLSPGEP